MFGITTLPNLIDVTSVKLVPDITMLSPPAWGPLLGVMPETVGGGEVISNRPATNSMFKSYDAKLVATIFAVEAIIV